MSKKKIKLADSKKVVIEALEKMGGNRTYKEISTEIARKHPSHTYHKFIYNTLPKLQELNLVSRRGIGDKTMWKINK